MDMSTHSMQDLFQQLGLPENSTEIDHFISSHSLKPGEKLVEASFWNANQAAFLRDAIADDSDWAEIVDQLDARLRSED